MRSPLKGAQTNRPARALPTRAIIVWSIVGVVILLASLDVYRRLEQFLIRDPRFTLNVAGGSSEPDSLFLTGATHSSARAIEAVFAEDAGRSVYLVPLSDRRATLRTVDWVKDASIARLWPNQIVVNVTERRPVARVAVTSKREGTHDVLIDEDGVILNPGQEQYRLPRLDGVSVYDTVAIRRPQIGRFLMLLRELGDAGAKITEVDISDPDDLKIQEPLEGRTVTLLLGDQHFALRHQSFLNYYAEIRKKLPKAAVLDLRLEDRITVVE